MAQLAADPNRYLPRLRPQSSTAAARLECAVVALSAAREPRQATQGRTRTVGGTRKNGLRRRRAVAISVPVARLSMTAVHTRPLVLVRSADGQRVYRRGPKVHRPRRRAFRCRSCIESNAWTHGITMSTSTAGSGRSGHARIGHALGYWYRCQVAAVSPRRRDWSRWACSAATSGRWLRFGSTLETMISSRICCSTGQYGSSRTSTP